MEKWVSLAGLIMPCKWCNKTELPRAFRVGREFIWRPARGKRKGPAGYYFLLKGLSSKAQQRLGLFRRKLY